MNNVAAIEPTKTYLLASTIGRLLADDDSIPLVDFNPEWAGATGYFDYLFRIDGVAVENNAMVRTFDEYGRWMLIGRRDGLLHLLFQRYSASEPRSEQMLDAMRGEDTTTVVFQYAQKFTGPDLDEEPNIVADVLEAPGGGAVCVEQILTFLGCFQDNGTAAFMAIESELESAQNMRDSFLNHPVHSGSGEAAVHSMFAEQPSNQSEKETTMSNANNNPQNANAQAKAAPESAKIEQPQTAPNPAASPNAAHAVDTIKRATGYSNWKKAGWLVGGGLLGAAITEGARALVNKYA